MIYYFFESLFTECCNSVTFLWSFVVIKSIFSTFCQNLKLTRTSWHKFGEPRSSNLFESIFQKLHSTSNSRAWKRKYVSTEKCKLGVVSQSFLWITGSIILSVLLKQLFDLYSVSVQCSLFFHFFSIFFYFFVFFQFCLVQLCWQFLKDWKFNASFLTV